MLNVDKCTKSAKMKNKQVKLYIPVFYERQVEGKEDYKENKVTLINALKVPLLKEILPDEETLKVHMQIQRIKVERDENYQPASFEICLEKSKFTNIIKEVKKKNKDVVIKDNLPLFTAWPGLPICLITIRK